MNLFIQVKEGQPVNHPALEQNLIEAFGQVPPDWEPFIRVERPTPLIYEIVEDEQPSYRKINGVWMDYWYVRPMTNAEKTSKQQRVKDFWASRPYASNWAAWTFDENLCEYVPPIPRPAPVEGKRVFWCGAENNWKEVPPLPDQGNSYIFDFYQWKWVKNSNA